VEPDLVHEGDFLALAFRKRLLRFFDLHKSFHVLFRAGFMSGKKEQLGGAEWLCFCIVFFQRNAEASRRSPHSCVIL
jgi:hypothetical protein